MNSLSCTEVNYVDDHVNNENVVEDDVDVCIAKQFYHPGFRYTSIYFACLYIMYIHT